MKKLFIALFLFAATLMTGIAQNAQRVPETMGMQPAKAVLVIEGTTGNNDKIPEDCFVGLTQISQEIWKFEFKNKNGETSVDLHLRDIVTKNDSTDVYMFDQGTLVWERVYDEAPLSQNISAYSMSKLTFQNNEPRSPFNKIQFLFRDR